MSRDLTLNEYIKEFLNNDETNLFSPDYTYPTPFDDVEIRNRIAWYARVLYRNLIVDDMLTADYDNGELARMFVKNGLEIHKRNIERIYAIMTEDIPILSDNEFTETKTSVYGEKNTTNITGARSSSSTDGAQKSVVTNSKSSFDDVNVKIADVSENNIDAVVNQSNTEQATDTSKQDTYTDTVTIKRQGLLDDAIPDYIFKELKACGFDYVKYFAKLLADIITYPFYM
ncbi:MAG: hypothetical protein U0L88_13155 [Acutalibacteraceae bacterium]|nr:hypothetical protein [Acutalibacteraceae bacterium]